ncbi:MAG: hypothetical protein H7245_19400 [Candidatus Saccharibacteria bacterium]|nr:hypothetical protein [Pseudorhodobacter sp.]
MTYVIAGTAQQLVGAFVADQAVGVRTTAQHVIPGPPISVTVPPKARNSIRRTEPIIKLLLALPGGCWVTSR